ncbi:MAG: GNAT family N-acetyltransferase [Comamonadaceae bacterium]|nr:GNAT family N-acetyltransferase [Comamonadaceae bacterium]
MTVCDAPPPLGPPGPWPASARLRLREFDSADIADVQRMHQDARVRAQLVDDVPLHEAARAAAFVQGMRAFYREHEGTGIWCAERAVPPDPDSVAEARAAFAAGEIEAPLLALVEAPTWRFCGWFSLVHVQHAPQEVEIGARLRPEAWCGTLALDGGEWLLARAFAQPGRARVFGYCDPANRSAAHCLRALGFSAAGTAPYNGHTAAAFVLTREEWQASRELPRRERLRRASCTSRAA